MRMKNSLLESRLRLDEVIGGLVDEKPSLQKNGQKTEKTTSLFLKKGNYDPSIPDEREKERIEVLNAWTAQMKARVICPVKKFEPGRFQINYEQELNSQQLAAVTHIKKPTLVIAGAGSGKTRVITYKVAYLIENGVSPGEILLLTFTRKAANEMLDRVKGLLGEVSTGNVLGGTFHSFANYALRKHATIIGLPVNFSIIDNQDTADIIDLMKTELGIGAKEEGSVFPNKKKIQEILSRAKNLERTVAEVIADFSEENIPYSREIELLGEASARYKKASGLLDYDDLLLVLRDNLKINQPFREKIQKEVRYILVDEYQDTNNAQREIVELLAEKNGLVTVVGDDAQSIYGFRGAMFENILKFPGSFPDCGVVTIEKNYRSTSEILDFCNDVIAGARIGFRKEMWSDRTTGKIPKVRKFADGVEEAEYIVDTVFELTRNDLEFNDFAVLTRAGWQSNFVQAELLKRGVPFIVVGGIKFIERRHIRDMIALLKISSNPLDAVSWHRTLKLIQGIGKVRAKEIVDHIRQNNGQVDFSEFSTRTFYPEIKRLQDTINVVRETNLPLVRIVEKFLGYYQPILKQIEDDFLLRKKDLEVFTAIASRYDNLEKFLSDFALEPPSTKFQDETIPLLAPDQKPMVISTIHSAKGLEWHTVFLPHALDGLIPSVRNMETIEDLEEERRLFYVAASRAKENLYVSMPGFVANYDGFFTEPCRFLKDVKADHFQFEE